MGWAIAMTERPAREPWGKCWACLTLVRGPYVELALNLGTPDEERHQLHHECQGVARTMLERQIVSPA